jgi:hypothetical protein
MFSTIKKVLVAGALVLATAVGFSTTAAAQERRFTVFNRSSYRINHLYVSPTSYTYWGSDRLGSDIFYPNYRFDLSVAPGWYDIKLVDQDGDSCVVGDVDSRDGESSTITNATLLMRIVFSLIESGLARLSGGAWSSDPCRRRFLSRPGDHRARSGRTPNPGGLWLNSSPESGRFLCRYSLQRNAAQGWLRWRSRRWTQAVPVISQSGNQQEGGNCSQQPWVRPDRRSRSDHIRRIGLSCTSPRLCRVTDTQNLYCNVVVTA